MHLQLNTGNTERFTVKGDTVYVSGYAEGYLTKQQPEQAVDKGFAVHRRYERLMPDGLHPSDEGHAIIARRLGEFLKML